MKPLNEIRKVKENVEQELLKRPGVTGVDIGKKFVKGKETDELSIRVYVEQKKDVPPDQKIPEDINGVKTDIIQRKFVLHDLRVPVTALRLQSDTGTYNPLRGGISVGPCRVIDGFVYVGTLGAIVTDNDSGKQMMLSNFHVMCVDSGWHTGDKMAQPGQVDGGACPLSVAGSLQRAQLTSEVDGAIASIEGRTSVNEIIGLGTVTGVGAATTGMQVYKRGRTTGLTYGTVDNTDLSVNIDYGDGLGERTLVHQISIKPDPQHSAKFGDHGDSGSVVVDSSMRVIGLYFAGSDDGQVGLANPIQSVLTALNISVPAAQWRKLPGAARDIGVGADGSVWVIGTNYVGTGGYGIYKWNGSTWDSVSGAASRIAVGPDGKPWVVNALGAIYKRTDDSWQQLPGAARDIGVGADSSVWVIGTNYVGTGGYGIYKWNGTDWDRVSGAASRIAVGPDGKPWVVNALGAIYKRTDDSWQQLPGAARDIGVGADGSVWVIGTNYVGTGGYGIYKWNGSSWVNVEGAAAAISIGPGGKPWVVNNIGSIYEKT